MRQPDSFHSLSPVRTAVAAVVAVFLLGLPLSPAGAETLEEALAKAYQNNPTLLAARARLRATDEGVPQALSGWRPTVSVDVQGGKTYSSNTNGNTITSGQSFNLTPRSGSVTLTQNIYKGGRTVSETNKAEQSVLSERAHLASTEQDTMVKAATAYMNVVRDQAVLRLNQNNERVLQRQLEATRDRFRVGEVTRTDVAQAESRLSRARSDRIQAEGDLAKSRASYRDIIGDMPGTLAPARPLGDLPANADEAMQRARTDSPDVLSAQFTERAAAADVRSITGELLPSVDVKGDLSRDFDSTTSFDRTDSGSVTATLTVPLYQAGGVSARVRAAKQTDSQRRQELEAAIRTAIATATQSWESYQTARAQIQAYGAEVHASEIALDGVRQEAQVGSRTVLDVLDAEQELLTARVNLVRAQRDEVVTSFQLRQSVGTAVASKLGLPVKPYNYKSYYDRVRNKWFGLGIGGE